jgi:hypothetical protein
MRVHGSLLVLALASACTQPGGQGDELDGASASSSSDAADTGTASEASEVGTSSESETSTASEADTSTSSESEAESETGAVERGRVLFVGNSYTFSNDLPGLFAATSASVGAAQDVDSLAVAGTTVAYHVANPELVPLLEQGWDVVVIQAQSYEAIVDEPGYQAAMVEFAGLVAAASPGARLLVFETWARAPGDPLLADLGMTPEQMQAALSEAYAEAAQLVDAELAPVGQAWALSLASAPAITLHFSDGSHPSLAGSYLAAAVFHAQVLGQPAAAIAWVPEGLAPADAMQLAAFADQVVMP